MYIIIGLGLICATIGFVVGSAVRWKIDYEAETIGSLIVAQADENENPSLFLNLGGEMCIRDRHTPHKADTRRQM